MRHCLCTCAVAILLMVIVVPAIVAAEFQVNGHTMTIPDGFEVIQIAGPPLVNRPISADFDETGRLYVTDSSGSNDDVEIQVKTRPHRIVRLEDTDGDGVFDKSVVFADKLMFPEGALWHAGSLYVAAPPEIWKFTDVDDDGKADHREVWFDGKTLTHCANDLHGPYMGLDGWMYWCKGAYAEQTYERPGRSPLVTSAAHIFRRHPDGGPVEIVMTGGMANPVDVVFTPGGERIFTTTFLTRPQAGLRDGLIHAVYGGVYGQDRPQLNAHPRTGPLMPVLDHLGAAAPCGLERLESDQLGSDYQNNLMTCLFNMQKVTRHVLKENGATFVSETTDFLLSDNRDFHPTDVIEDADGSLIVVDTGGWYKLCCPTSQLWKPDILGAIYRVRRVGSHAVDDPRGERIDWSSQSIVQMCALLADSRKPVRRQAAQQLSKQGGKAVDALGDVVRPSRDAAHRRQAIWTLTQINSAEARDEVRAALDDDDAKVRQVALHSISLHRDAKAVPRLVELLRGNSLHNRRAAAEALGRIASGKHTAALLAATVSADNRELEHSLIYAAIEIADADALRCGLKHDSSSIQRAAVIALDQMEGSDLASDEVVPLLRSSSQALRETAWWVMAEHPDWADTLVSVFREMLCEGQTMGLAPRLARFGEDPQIQELLGQAPIDPSLSTTSHNTVLAAMVNVATERLPNSWHPALLQGLESSSAHRVQAVLKVLRLQKKEPLQDSFVERLSTIALDAGFPVDSRLRAMTLVPPAERRFDSGTFKLLSRHITSDQPVALRALALEVLQKTQLDRAQLMALVTHVPQTGPMELRRLIEVFAKSKDKRVGLALVESLADCPSVTSLRPDELQQQLEVFGDAVHRQAKPLIESIERENADLLDKLNAMLELTKSGDIRNGQAIFHGTKAACSACHAAGYLGGRIGPGLMRIGLVRTERDLLESILFPSPSFVQSYEPVTIVTKDGLSYSGLITEETNDRIQLQLDAQKVVTVAVADIEQRGEGTVSIMPAGLEKQLTLQELADVVAFLKSAN